MLTLPTGGDKWKVETEMKTEEIIFSCAVLINCVVTRQRCTVCTSRCHGQKCVSCYPKGFFFCVYVHCIIFFKQTLFRKTVIYSV